MLRNGDVDKVELDITPSSIQPLCVKFKMFKECIESCKRNQVFMEKNTEFLIDWMEGMSGNVSSMIPNNERLSKEFRRKQVSAIFNIYNSAALAAKQIQHIYDTYYMTKLDVLNEAIVFYTKVIRQAFVEGKAKV
jgi:hypothetical protein